jgi:hypothetical protein
MNLLEVAKASSGCAMRMARLTPDFLNKITPLSSVCGKLKLIPKEAYVRSAEFYLTKQGTVVVAISCIESSLLGLLDLDKAESATKITDLIVADTYVDHDEMQGWINVASFARGSINLSFNYSPKVLKLIDTLKTTGKRPIAIWNLYPFTESRRGNGQPRYSAIEYQGMKAALIDAAGEYDKAIDGFICPECTSFSIWKEHLTHRAGCVNYTGGDYTEWQDIN